MPSSRSRALPSERIDKLARQAMKTWLEFAMHRCRLLVGLTGTGTTEMSERVEEIRKGAVALTVFPSLTRCGNHKGADLLNETTISAGDVLRIG